MGKKIEGKMGQDLGHSQSDSPVNTASDDREMYLSALCFGLS